MTTQLKSIDPAIQAAAITAAATLVQAQNNASVAEKAVATHAIRILREYLAQREEADRIDTEEGEKKARDYATQMPTATR